MTLAAYAAETGALEWGAPVSRYLPYLKGTHLDQVSLLNLATHTTGGMPLQLPDTVKTSAELRAYFQGWVPPSAPGTVRTYANPSTGLLGEATAAAMQGDFAALVRDTVFAPLVSIIPTTLCRRPRSGTTAQGYTRDGRPVRCRRLPSPMKHTASGPRPRTCCGFVAAQVGWSKPARRYAGPWRRPMSAIFRAGPMTQAPIWEWYPLPVTSADLLGRKTATTWCLNPTA